MTKTARFPQATRSPARIEYLRVQNYRALRDIEIKDIRGLTVLLGPNGSGKSTIFDVFSFLSECFQYGLRHAWDRRGRGRELKTRGQSGSVVIELKYRETLSARLMIYHLAVDETPQGRVYVAEEWLQWTKAAGSGRPYRFLEFRNGEGFAVTGQDPDERDTRVATRLLSPDLIAVSALGQFAEHPRVAALREFIIDWYVSYLSIEDTRGLPESGPQERLSKTGDNLPNVIQYLKEQHPERLERIFQALRRRVPRLESVLTEVMPDGRLLLQIKDAPFEQPILSRFASDGTLKMLAYLTVLYDPEPPRFIGIEEPENFLHPRLLLGLAEECRRASEASQLLVTTHSPFFLDGLRPNEVRVLYRDDNGFTHAQSVATVAGVKEFIEEGATLGALWMEGHFNVGDPLTQSGSPQLPLPLR